MDTHPISISSAVAPPLDGAALLEKERALFDSLCACDSLLVALSGGADSAYLAWAAHESIGARALSVTALSASFSAHDRNEVEAFVHHTRVPHIFIETHEFENPLYVANAADRCYHCKDELFACMHSLAGQRGFEAVAYGINADDTRDFRPGHRAAREHRVLAPLLDAGLRKEEIRRLSRRAGLPTWDRPASACLSSRVPYGTAVTPDLLARIERAEAALRALGFLQFRVRAFGELARIELDRQELARGFEPECSRQITAGVQAAGFARVELDPEGYRQGSLNALLKSKQAGA
jgi:uncharacterized protein